MLWVLFLCVQFIPEVKVNSHFSEVHLSWQATLIVDQRAPVGWFVTSWLCVCYRGTVQRCFKSVDGTVWQRELASFSWVIASVKSDWLIAVFWLRTLPAMGTAIRSLVSVCINMMCRWCDWIQSASWIGHWFVLPSSCWGFPPLDLLF